MAWHVTRRGDRKGKGKVAGERRDGRGQNVKSGCETAGGNSR